MTSSCIARRSYQVFLSFRGADIRKTFIDHLYTRLDDAGIRTFKDDEELEKGKNIESELQTAILESRIAIIVFSENYASSSWCLDEVVRILECKNNAGLEIFPVFYHVEPSQVRFQRGSFSTAFKKHEGRFMNKIAGWKAALKEVADLGGMELHDGYESMFIKNVVQVVENKLKRRTMNVPDYLIGIRYRVRPINRWVQDGSNNVGIFTIYGPGGMGKTTIAKIVYNLNHTIFEACGFLPNVRETLERPEGLLHLYKRLLSQMLHVDKVKICNPDEGLNKMRDVISSKRVLLVIDDVDEKTRMKLDPLLSIHHLFCPGSKIILTTRHKGLLKHYKVYKDYKLENFDENESLKLFSWHAFGQDLPIEEYTDLSKRFVSYCGGLPLALQVLGSSLNSESMDAWGSRLEKLEEIPNPEIFEILKESYDSLPDDGDKNLFLDIACFFIGEEKSQVVTILNACDFHATVGLENLINRSLLTIDVNTNTIMMHQLLRDMGRAIVRQKSPYKPGKRCRLWHHKDSFNVLKQKMGTKTVEGLRLDMDALKEDKVCLMSCNINYENGMVLQTDEFTGMQSLRLLQINNVQLTGGYKQFPKNLKYLSWHRLPCRYLPRSFPSENLVAIDIRHSNITQLWTGTKVLRCLKILNLSHCQGIIKAPEFSQFPCLERLILKGCQSLVEVHESIVELEGLLLLDLHDCKSLRKLPNNIGKLKALETFIISGCSNLEELPTDLYEMEYLKVFYADGISFRTSNSATKEETSWRSYIWSLVCKPKQVPIFSGDSLPPSLISLSLVNCNLSDDAFPRDFGGMPLLQNVDLSHNPICFLPDCVKHVRRLNKLRLTGCRSLKTVIGLPSIQDLTLIQCTSLEKVTFQTQWHPSSLVSLSECEKLVDMEGIFKVVPIGKIDAEMLSYFGWQEYYLESMKSIKMVLFNRYTGEVNTGPIQGVYEYGGIFSIFLPGDSNVSNYFAHRTCGHSISLTVPSSSPNARIRGFNLRVVYARKMDSFPYVRSFMAQLFNYTKSLQLDFYPAIQAVPGDGEDIIWLSHWNFGSPHLEAGDEICVKINFAKELAVHLEYEDQERMSAQSSSMVCYESWKED